MASVLTRNCPYTDIKLFNNTNLKDSIIVSAYKSVVVISFGTKLNRLLKKRQKESERSCSS